MPFKPKVLPKGKKLPHKGKADAKSKHIALMNKYNKAKK